MATPLLFKRHFQLAYVVDDAGAGIDHMRRHFGIHHWDVMEMGKHMPGSPAHSIANAWVGDVMVELIQPSDTVASIYSDWRRGSGSLLRFHHLGFLIDSAEEFAAIRAGLVQSGFPVAVEGSFGDVLDYAYLDTTPELGHYHEIIHLKAGGAGFFDRIPRN